MKRFRSKIKAKHVLYILGMLAVVVWLFISTPLVARVVNQSKIMKVNFEEVSSQYTKDRVYYSFLGDNPDYIRYAGGPFQKLDLNGWALCETWQDNSNRKMAFLLHDTQRDLCYEMAPDIVKRYDVPNNLPGIVGREEMGIPSPNVGFQDEISTLEMKNGVYDLYICCWENTDNYGIMDTGYQIEKGNDSIEVYRWRGQRVSEPVKATEGEAPVGYLDAITIDGACINISDFVFVEGENCDTQRVYIEFANESGQIMQYTTKCVTRNDVAEAYGSEMYTQSGFQAQIPLDDFSDGTYTVKILVENNGKVWESPSYSMTKAPTITLQQ